MDLEALPLIGGGGDEGDVAFGAIQDLEIGDDGSVFVLDDMNREVLVFDEQGDLLRTFGRRGQGPGELEQPSNLLWDPAGNLWVVDPGNGRTTVFDADGGVVDTYRHTDPDAMFSQWAIGFSAEGRLYVVASGPDLVRPEFHLVAFEVADFELREIERFELPFVELPSSFEHEGEGMLLVLPIPFSAAPALGIGSNGELWYASTREPWVHRWSLPDGVEKTFGRDFEPPRVSGAELQAAMNQDPGVEELRDVAGPRVFAEFTGLIPETKPHLAGFFVDDEENLWIMRSAGADDDARLMDLYDSTGELVATARAPLEPVPRPRVRNDLIIGVVLDEFGVASIARYRFRR